jgi:hypothetical protein
MQRRGDDLVGAIRLAASEFRLAGGEHESI